MLAGGDFLKNDLYIDASRPIMILIAGKGKKQGVQSTQVQMDRRTMYHRGGEAVRMTAPPKPTSCLKFTT